MKSHFKALVAAVAYYAGLAAADVVSTCPSNGGGVCFKLAVPQASASSGSGNLYMQVSAPTTLAWVALGTGTSMVGSNIFVVYQDGRGNLTLSPRLGTDHTMPVLDTSTGAAQLTLLAGSGVSADGKTMTANIACSNCNSWNSGAGSLSLASTSSGWIAGWYTGTLASTDRNAAIGRHNDVAIFTVDLTKATVSSDSNPFLAQASTNGSSSSGSSSGSSSTANGVSTVAGPSMKVLAAHGIIMAIVMVILYPLGSLLMPALGNWKVHAAFQSLAFVLMWIGFGLGVKAAKERNMLFKQTHTTFGTVITCLFVLQPVLGQLHHQMYLRTGGRTAVSHSHIWYGRALMVLGIVNGGLGLKLVEERNSLIVAYSVLAGIFGFTYLVGAAAGAFWRSRKVQTQHGIDANKDVSLREMPPPSSSGGSPRKIRPTGGSRERFV